jgi:hypothetical protein
MVLQGGHEGARNRELFCKVGLSSPVFSHAVGPCMVLTVHGRDKIHTNREIKIKIPKLHSSRHLLMEPRDEQLVLDF